MCGRLNHRRTNRGWLAVKVATAIVVAAAASGCARSSDLVSYSPNTGFHLGAPPPDRAMVVFLRPAYVGNAISAAVYNDDEFLGIVMRHSYIAAPTSPGTHRFMVVSEAADFLGADLEGGKIYFVNVVPRMGWWRARFSLQAITPSSPEWADLGGWLAESREATLNDEGRAWARENQASVKEKKDAYLVDWLSKPEAERPVLRPGDGVSRF